MQFNELVTVVMPVHNGERFIAEAIESVLVQTYTNFEFLIVENCSTDSSLNIINSFKDPRIKLIIEDDCGQVQAYNRGFREAKGKYIFIHDQDDVSILERFKLQIKYITENNLEIIGSYFIFMRQNGQEFRRVKVPVDPKEIERRYYFKTHSLYNPTLCLKREIFKKFGFFYNEYFPSSDFEFGLRVIPQSLIGNVPEFLILKRLHNHSLSQSNLKSGLNNAFLISSNYLQRNKQRYSKEEFVLIMSNIYYYYNKLFNCVIFIIKNISLINNELIILLLKSILFFIPLKVLRTKNLFNTKSIIFLRNYIFKTKN